MKIDMETSSTGPSDLPEIPKTSHTEETGSSDFVDDHVRSDIVTFLRGLADSLEKKTLDSTVEKQVSEFFLRFNFGASLFDNLESTEDNENVTDNELVKFLSLGWYVYTQMVPRPDDHESPKEDNLD
jgi:hypothetical protein